MKKKIFLSIPLIIIFAILVRIWLVSSQQKAEFAYHNDIPKTIEVFSSDFKAEDMMPIECTGDGKNMPPALSWHNLPTETKSVVLLAVDYDAPSPSFKVFTIDHWVVFNMPPEMDSLAKGITTEQLQKMNISSGVNITGGLDYTGPKPPFGLHKYYFRVYALSVPSLGLTKPTKTQVMEAMKGKILAYGELVGKYKS